MATELIIHNNKNIYASGYSIDATSEASITNTHDLVANGFDTGTEVAVTSTGAIEAANYYVDTTLVVDSNKNSSFTTANASGSIKLKGKNIADLLYPVGTVYSSTDSKNPGMIFGGTWEAYGGGKVLVGAGGGYTAGATGGVESVTLSADHLPAHSHSVTSVSSSGSHYHNISGISTVANHNHTIPSYLGGSTQHQLLPESRNDTIKATKTTTSAGSHSHGVSITTGGAHTHGGSIGSTGGGNSHSNMQAYLVVYMFRRTA